MPTAQRRPLCRRHRAVGAARNLVARAAADRLGKR